MTIESWSRARWKRIEETIQKIYEYSKNFKNLGVWVRISIFGHFGPFWAKNTKIGIIWIKMKIERWSRARWKRSNETM